MKLKLFDIQRFSVHDGPGIRTCVFLKGCILCCKWCHNPESIRPERQMLYYESKCKGCGMCVPVCPAQANRMEDGRHKYDRDLCILCGGCQLVCQERAFEIAGYEIEAEELLEKIRRDAPFYTETGGGVTFTGGEPLMQEEALLAILRRCKEAGIHTAVETCLMTSKQVIDRLRPYIDLWICDMKAYTSALHKAYTGADNASIKSNIEYLADLCAENMWIRIPLIAGINAEEAEVENMAEFLQPYSFQRVEVMPYHDIGVSKYRALGQQYPLEDETLFVENEVQRFKGILQGNGVKGLV